MLDLTYIYMYMYMYIIYIYICIYIHMHTHAYTHTYIHTYVHTYIHTNTIQYNTIQYKTRQDKTRQDNTIQYNTYNYIQLHTINVGCLIVITPPNFFIFIFYLGGGQPSYNNFWESIAGRRKWGQRWWRWRRRTRRRRRREEGEEGEGEGGGQNWSCGKKFPLLPCLVQVCYCYSGACKGGTLCGPVFLLFLIRVLKEISCLAIGSDFWSLSFC